MDNVSDLIQRLASEDRRTQRQAGDALQALGDAAIPALIEALRSGDAAVRKPAAFILGRSKHPEVIAALGSALHDPEAKVRKNAAVSLSKIAAEESVQAVVEALELEDVIWVRTSLILTLGAIATPEAGEALRSLPQSADPDEAEALRKALDRCTPRRHTLSWANEQPQGLRFLLEVPDGLEPIARAEANEKGMQLEFGPRPGLLVCPPELDARSILSKLRCSYALLIEAGKGELIDFHDAEAAAAIIQQLISQSEALGTIREWTNSNEAHIRYRFAIYNAVHRDTLRKILDAVRQICEPMGLIDSPSNYDLELYLESDHDSSRLFIRPSFVPDKRFEYRERDVGGSINPVVGACLARMVFTKPGALVLDPTCGSGTLLIERAQLDRESEIWGMDISDFAVKAAQENVRTAGLTRQIEVVQGDSANPGRWEACDEVIANLPFGMRSRHEEQDLMDLYRNLIANIAENLNSDGRALIYSVHQGLVERCLRPQNKLLRVESHRRVYSGGLWVHIWLLARR
jgi:23S rRNA G2445 N2-methylase RlmL